MGLLERVARLAVTELVVVKGNVAVVARNLPTVVGVPRTPWTRDVAKSRPSSSTASSSKSLIIIISIMVASPVKLGSEGLRQVSRECTRSSGSAGVRCGGTEVVSIVKSVPG